MVFHRVLDLLDAAGWQVRQQEEGLHILVAAPGPGFDQQATVRAVRGAIAAAGVAPLDLRVSMADEVPAGAAGKRPLVVALPAPRTGTAGFPETFPGSPTRGLRS